MNNLKNFLKAVKFKNRHFSLKEEISYEEKFHLFLNEKIKVLTIFDEEYPKSFHHIDEPPEVLYLYGDESLLSKNSLAVVGSREPRNTTVHWLESNLGKTLKDLDLVVVSGGARGVDQIAHAISLRAVQKTIVVLPGGIHQPYPMNIEKRDRLVQLGAAFITEYEPNIKMQKHHFIKRNRLISALAQAALVVEAKARGGTMITARYAIDQGRPLFVVPFHPMDINGLGNLKLIQDGASMVIDSADLNLMLNIELKCFSQKH